MCLYVTWNKTNTDLWFVHQIIIGPVLRTCQALCNNHEMKPVALKLMLSLWKQDGRVYVQFHQQLKDINIEDSPFEHVLVKAVCIREICRHRYF